MNLVRRHPAVQDVAAYGIPRRELASEDELMLSIVLREVAAPTPEDLCSFINDAAPYYFVPRYMAFVQELHYTPTNKVKKYRLRQAGLSDATWDRKRSAYSVRK